MKSVKTQRKPRNYWNDFTNVQRELLEYIHEHGTTGIMPTGEDLRQAGRNDLDNAIRKYGGVQSVAERLKLTVTKRRAGYWNDFENLKSAILAFIEEHGTHGVMPTESELKKVGRNDLAIAILRKHGGYRMVATRMALVFAYKISPRNYWHDFSNIEREILNYIGSNGTEGVMPTQQELQKAGRSDLVSAIKKHGDYQAVAERLGLTYAKRRDGYWDDPSNLERELLTYISEHGTPGVMPAHEELSKGGRSDLASAISTHGGYRVVAERFGLKVAYAAKSPGYWSNSDNLKRELLSFIENNGMSGVMPTRDQLVKTGYGALAAGIAKQGGHQKIAEQLRLSLGRKHPNYWDDFDNYKNALLAFIEEHGKSGVMPTQNELVEARRHDLANATWRNHGGYPVVARRLGLKFAYIAKPTGHWDNISNLQYDLLSFIDEHGTQGIMPKHEELQKAGRDDLAAAIQKHGGYAAVARHFNLIHTGPEFITPRTASAVERTARAIQPLAESNLLSGAQVMVILRRAGLLEYRNPRVVRLSASLARGDHDEIESAIANLVSGGEEIAAETVTLTESDDLTAAEAEALLKGEGATLAPTLTPQTISDTQREQAVIRGLSALGEMRLPLDEVLRLLTCKVLWQEFYKRLYAWYGSLDARQTVTAADVEAAILAAYPEHTANEFVAEASALFTVEVEQAVNFAASLLEVDWRGPRLRLHQADAARRMADVLVGAIHESPLPSVSFILNADDPGMGKSAAFLAAVAASGIHSVLLIAPKTVCDDTWCAQPRGEIARCLPHARIVRGLASTLSARTSARVTFFVLHYEELLNEEAVAALAKKSFDCLCLDEIHFIKQRAGQDPTERRRALETLRASARVAIGLTGTPLVNELSEPLSLLQVLSQHAPQFEHARLSSRRLRDIADVFEALLPHIVRRRKVEVLLHLPQCDVIEKPIPIGDLAARMLDLYRLPKSQASHALIELRKIAIEAKLAYLVEQAIAARKLLVLTYLADDVSEKIAAYLENFLPNQVAHINGLVSKDERQQRLDSFRAPDGKRVLVGTIGTIGVGLTLFDPTHADTANEIIVADLPYTWAEFEQGIARLHREGQKQRVTVEVLLTTTVATLRDGSPHQTIDERIWALIKSKSELSDVAIDGKYDTSDSDKKVKQALQRWLKQAREIGVEPLAVERRTDEQSDAQRWRSEIGRLRALSAARADEVFADPEYTRQFLVHLETSTASKLSHQWLRERLKLFLRPDLTIVDMGCGLNALADLPCRVIGLDRHDRAGQLRGKLENPPLPDRSADVLIYSLSLYGTANDLNNYFTQAARILRGGGHLFIVEPDSAFTTEGLARFVGGLRQCGFELVGLKEIHGEDGIVLKGMHFTLTGEMGKPEESAFERK